MVRGLLHTNEAAVAKTGVSVSSDFFVNTIWFGDYGGIKQRGIDGAVSNAFAMLIVIKTGINTGHNIHACDIIYEM
jgi:hypothetical protein